MIKYTNVVGWLVVLAPHIHTVISIYLYWSEQGRVTRTMTMMMMMMMLYDTVFDTQNAHTFLSFGF